MRMDIAQLEYLDPKLRKVVLWLEEETGLEFMNTSNYRMNGRGVHSTLPVRGFDVRMRNERLGHLLAEIINEVWIYDPDRPEKKCAVAHGEGEEFHLHIQSHPNTIFIG